MGSFQGVTRPWSRRSFMLSLPRSLRSLSSFMLRGSSPTLSIWAHHSATFRWPSTHSCALLPKQKKIPNSHLWKSASGRSEASGYLLRVEGLRRYACSHVEEGQVVMGRNLWTWGAPGHVPPAPTCPRKLTPSLCRDFCGWVCIHQRV
ncbi:uncharacterized [Tachysurus ichikawai]